MRKVIYASLCLALCSATTLIPGGRPFALGNDDILGDPQMASIASSSRRQDVSQEVWDEEGIIAKGAHILEWVQENPMTTIFFSPFCAGALYHFWQGLAWAKSIVLPRMPEGSGFITPQKGHKTCTRTISREERGSSSEEDINKDMSNARRSDSQANRISRKLFQTPEQRAEKKQKKHSAASLLAFSGGGSGALVMRMVPGSPIDGDLAALFGDMPAAGGDVLGEHVAGTAQAAHSSPEDAHDVMTHVAEEVSFVPDSVSSQGTGNTLEGREERHVSEAQTADAGAFFPFSSSAVLRTKQPDEDDSSSTGSASPVLVTYPE